MVTNGFPTDVVRIRSFLTAWFLLEQHLPQDLFFYLFSLQLILLCGFQMKSQDGPCSGSLLAGCSRLSQNSPVDIRSGICTLAKTAFISVVTDQPEPMSEGIQLFLNPAKDTGSGTIFKEIVCFSKATYGKCNRQHDTSSPA